ncbi:MAG TPA: hypothetical protein PLQ13_14885 [Candidatus Krumholzibacteria bacterium]|nr:hypothetical protein [Candidatus Krumholzibacteria bacterium]
MKWRIGGAAVLVVVLAAIVTLVGLRTSITRSLDELAAAARAAEPGSEGDVAALLAWVADESVPVDQRNRGVWALGQLRDARALPVLESLRVPECRHGTDICQHELDKAIALCGGGKPDPLRVGGRLR